MRKSQPLPEPVVMSTVCSQCGEPWEAHGESPTLLDCIRLLKGRPTTTITYSPYYVQPVYPITPPYYVSCEVSGGNSGQLTTGSFATTN